MEARTAFRGSAISRGTVAMVAALLAALVLAAIGGLSRQDVGRPGGSSGEAHGRRATRRVGIRFGLELRHAAQWNPNRRRFGASGIVNRRVVPTAWERAWRTAVLTSLPSASGKGSITGPFPT